MKKIINKKSLKGTLAVMLCAVMAFSVCACDFDSDTEPTKTDAQIQLINIVTICFRKNLRMTLLPHILTFQIRRTRSEI